MINQEGITSSQNQNNLLITDPKDMKTCDLPNEEFKIVILGKCNELPKNIERKVNKIMKAIHKQN